jgi:hypothetical protein
MQFYNKDREKHTISYGEHPSDLPDLLCTVIFYVEFSIKNENILSPHFPGYDVSSCLRKEETAHV